MKYVVKVSKGGVVSSFEADIRATGIASVIEGARKVLEGRGKSEVLLSVTPVPGPESVRKRRRG